MHNELTRRAAMGWAGAGLALPAIQFKFSEVETGWMPFTPKFVDLVRKTERLK